MGLPSIAPYPMPTQLDLPDNRVDWTLDPSRAALLIHDMQEYFVDAFDRSREPIPALIANIQRLRDAAHAAGIPVIYSAQPPAQTLEQRGLLQDFWGDGIGDEPGQADVIEALTPAPSDIELTKWRYSAFVRTDLHGELRAAGRDQLIITGIYAHIGCMMTAAQAFMEEVQPFLIADGVADFSRIDHHMALDYVARRCGMAIMLETALGQLGATSASATTNGAAPATNGASATNGAAPATNGASATNGAPRLGVAPSLAQLRAALRELADEPLDDLADDDDLSDAGIDSIRLMGVITQWQQAGLAVTFEELAEEPTIAAWAELLGRRGVPAGAHR